MAKFVGDGRRFNLDQIRQVILYKGDRIKIVYANGDEEERTRDEDEWGFDKLCEETIARQLPQIIPAQPGFTLLAFHWQDGDDPATFNIAGSIWRGTVIAWEIKPGDTIGRPVGISAEQRSDNDCDGWHGVSNGFFGVLEPNGAVFRECESYENVDQWVDGAREACRRYLEEKKAKKLKVVREG
jgi:hypothetical protein